MDQPKSCVMVSESGKTLLEEDLIYGNLRLLDLSPGQSVAPPGAKIKQP